MLAAGETCILMLVISFATWTRRSLELSVIDWLYLTVAGKPITFKVKLAMVQLVRHASWSETFARRHLIQVKDKDPPSDSMQLNRLHYIQSHWCNHSKDTSFQEASILYFPSIPCSWIDCISSKSRPRPRPGCGVGLHIIQKTLVSQHWYKRFELTIWNKGPT